MKPEKFPQANRRLMKPKGWTDAQCETLHCYGDSEQHISKWRMSWRERLRVLFTGIVWFRCIGFTHPPVSLEISHPWPTPINQRRWVPKWVRAWHTRRAIGKACKETVGDKLPVIYCK